MALGVSRDGFRSRNKFGFFFLGEAVYKFPNAGVTGRVVRSSFVEIVKQSKDFLISF